MIILYTIYKIFFSYALITIFVVKIPFIGEWKYSSRIFSILSKKDIE